MQNTQHPTYPPPFDGPGITKQQIYAHTDAEINSLLQEMDNANLTLQHKGLFLLGQANHWMEQASKQPEAQMLFGEFWHQGELCILFADTNLGKSILAVQIGDSISRGKPLTPFKLQTGGQKVIYFDFELSSKQFQSRYQNDDKQQYQWHPNFLRAEMNPDTDLPGGEYTFEDYLNLSLEKAVTESGATILIIDNLTYLRNETERAKDALPLMKHLKQMKSKYNLSILALAHTPKRDSGKPITRNDLQGSKMLMNFCDSAFAIGESQKDKNLRYLKQIKQRNTEEVYGSDNICLAQILKADTFLQYEFTDNAREWEHLRPQTDTDRDELKTKALEMKREGWTIREIADILQITKGKVEWLLKAGK